MAASSLLTLIDDIASVLDDVALLTKVAAKKTSGVLGDDLALNAQQVAGVAADRELPVVWAVAKGSLLNKLILVPTALAISTWVPMLVVPLLMLGGAFLCFEGVEKLAHKLLHDAAEDEAEHAQRVQALADPAVDLVAFEKDKIKGAIRTDFILSAEIITITLGTVAGQSFALQVAVLGGIALLMTIGVYGLVAGIVKLDDAGLYLSRRGGTALLRGFGHLLLQSAPYLMKFLSIAGTVAMFMVGGGILVEGFRPALTLEHELAHHAAAVPGVGGVLAAITPSAFKIIAGIAAGAVLLAVVAPLVAIGRRLRGGKN